MNRPDLAPASGARVALRALRADDAAALRDVLGDPRVMRYWSHAPLRTAADMAWYLRDAECGRRAGTHWRWAVVRVSDDRLIGTASLHGFSNDRRRASIGYALAHAAQGQGLAREAVTALVTIAFDTFALDVLEASVDAANLRSCAVLVRLGFAEQSCEAGDRRAFLRERT
ncbi:MAG: GNAT family N-acetyltransferase [Xanthomonadales bacterium]|nr:GNAT family N-acetyltransferase [Xanthomonadales bacterium]